LEAKAERQYLALSVQLAVAVAVVMGIQGKMVAPVAVVEQPPKVGTLPEDRLM
jgi:hypothetical protein|tara:strand:- start:492 stop:650 length:159 start_codon:yes stop_codon:yes gene_type:complete